MNLDVFYLKKILIKIWRKISISLAELYLLIKILILKLNLLSLYPTRSWISLLCYNRNIITTVPEIEEKKGRTKVFGSTYEKKHPDQGKKFKISPPSHTSNPGSTQNSQKSSSILKTCLSKI